MTDAHCHFSAGDGSVRELVVGRDFVGFHPWQADSVGETDLAELRRRLENNVRLGVGEIGLDRLRERQVGERMRNVFRRQLKMAVELNRPIVLHGAKCWGQVVEVVKQTVSAADGFDAPILFHGFSRSEGLLPEIFALGGYVSVGPAILNDHAVNYRKMSAKIPPDRLLIETDRDTPELGVTIQAVANGLAKVLNCDILELEKVTDANAATFCRDNLSH